MNKKQSPTDGFLIQQFLAGDNSVMPELVKRYHKLFCEKAYWVTKDKEIAKDVAQECWIVIMDKLSSLDNVNSFKSWALRIIYTRAIDAVKHRNKVRTNVVANDIVQPEVVSLEEERQRIQKALLKAIQELPKDKQVIIRLFYTEAYSINEISDFLNIPMGTVKSRLFQAREKLKSILKKNNYER